MEKTATQRGKVHFRWNASTPACDKAEKPFAGKSARVPALTKTPSAATLERTHSLDSFGFAQDSLFGFAVVHPSLEIPEG